MNITHRTPAKMNLAAQRARHIKTGHTERVTECTPSESELGAMMLSVATQERRSRRARAREDGVPNMNLIAGPSPMQVETLLAMDGDVTSGDISKVTGWSTNRASGFLSALCTKDFVERVGTIGQSTVFRKTRMGKATAERLRKE